MDPKQTLIDADQAISDLKFETAAYLLDVYRNWRRNGGFEPGGGWYSDTTRTGDQVLVKLQTRLANAARQAVDGKVA